MTAQIIDGKKMAATLRADIASATATLKQQSGKSPTLAVLIVGDDAASHIYVRNKIKATEEAGMVSRHFHLPAQISQNEILQKLTELNNDPDVNGILVQFPMPDAISQATIIEAINPQKDVDGLHPINAGRLASGLNGLAPATPLACVRLAKSTISDLAGLNVVILGRSNLVGKPVAQLFLRENCTVTIAHSYTGDVDKFCREADILIAAVGRPEVVKGDWLKKRCCVIDVGINRLPPAQEGGKARLVGDVDFNAALERAGFITPVPGGVGPMTIACLLRNTLFAYCAQNNLTMPKL